jgi:hypothetical protein
VSQAQAEAKQKALAKEQQQQGAINSDGRANPESAGARRNTVGQ